MTIYGQLVLDKYNYPVLDERVLPAYVPMHQKLRILIDETGVNERLQNIDASFKPLVTRKDDDTRKDARLLLAIGEDLNTFIMTEYEKWDREQRARTVIKKNDRYSALQFWPDLSGNGQ